MRRFTVLLALVSLLVGLAPGTASAQSIDLACPPNAVPSSGFTDVDPASVHKAAIDCVAAWGISTGTTPTTFDPKAAVTRWQMALFLIRTFELQWAEAAPGLSQGFVDIAGLPPETQKAINQLKELSITAGTTPSTFSPNGTLTRWEMALFLTRLLSAQGVALPGGGDQGFTDIGSLDQGFQVAINQLKQLGITGGTTPTTFSPHGLVTREQMASFLARTIQANADLPLLAVGTTTCDGAGDNCTENGTFAANVGFVIRAAWKYAPLPVAPEDQAILTPSTRAEVTWNGNPVVVVEKVVTLNNVLFKYYEAAFPGGLTGNHTFVVTYFDADQPVNTYTAVILFTG